MMSYGDPPVFDDEVPQIFKCDGCGFEVRLVAATICFESERECNCGGRFKLKDRSKDENP